MSVFDFRKRLNVSVFSGNFDLVCCDLHKTDPQTMFEAAKIQSFTNAPNKKGTYQ